MSKPANPIELVDRYLQAVRFWVPKTQRQEEILAELGEDLRSQIDAREEELGHPLSADEVAEILKRCGPPMVVAARLGPKSYLIGPTLFPIYWFVLKMVLFWILIPVFVFIVGPVNVVNSGGNWGTAIGNTIGDLWSGLFIAAGTITLVFAMFERTHAHAHAACKFDPLRLPPVRKEERKPSMVQTVCQLAFGVFGLIWLLLLPHYPVLILGPAAAFLKASPMWDPFYLPIVLLSLLALLRHALILARPQWGWLPSLGELVQGFLSLVLLKFILNAASQTHGGDWHPFVMVADAATNSPHYIAVAALVNVSILVSLVCAWLGLCIAMIVHTWHFLSYLRKRTPRTAQTATLQLR